MGMFSFLRKGIAPVFNYKRGIGIEDHKRQMSWIKSMIIALKPSKAEPHSSDSFAQWKEKNQISDGEIAQAIKNYHFESRLFLLLSSILIVYAIYLFTHVSFFLSGYVAIMLSLTLGLYALRAKLYAFQLTHQRMTITLKEWLREILGRR